MFLCTLGNHDRKPWFATIEDCPRWGLEAIDFRLANGLAPEPSNTVKMPSFQWEDEAFVRDHPELADGKADIDSCDVAGRQDVRWCNADGEICGLLGSSRRINHTSGDYVILPATVVAAWLKEQSPANAKMVFQAVWDKAKRDLEAAQAESREILAKKQAEVRALEAARELLKDELQALHACIARLESRVTELEEMCEQGADEGEDA